MILAEEEVNCEDLGTFASVGDRMECAVSDTAQGLLETLFNWLVGGATWAVEWTGTAWLSFPEPTIGTAKGVPSTTIDQIWTLGGFYIMGIAVISLLVGIVRLVWTPNRQSGMALLRGLAAIITVQTAGIAVTAILLDAGSQFSTWVVEEASGDDFATALADFSGMGGATSILLAGNALNSLGSAVAFSAVGFLILLIAAFAQVCLLIVRSVLIVILWAFLPFLASAAFTDGGSKALSRAVGWLFSLILYKPVAGIIYSIGILQMRNAADEPSVHEQMLNLLIAVVTVGFAALALPALIKFVAPQAAVGASMAFSGGAMAAGAVGTGAAVVALGATGGGSAAAGAGAGAASSGAVGTGAATAGAAAPAAEGAGTTAPAAEGAGTTAPTSGSGSGSSPKSGGQGAGGTSTTGPSDSDDSSSRAGSVTGEGASTDSGSAPSSTAPPSDTQGPGAQGSSSDGVSSSGAEGTESGSAPAPDGARTTDTNAGESPTSTSNTSSEPQGPDGAEQTAPPAPAPQGAGSTGGAHRSSQVAGAVRDVANGTRSGASDVDFNKGQEES
ncbi:hypothetical protein ABZ546_16225 [Brachybacterium paraconglomeratum]